KPMHFAWHYAMGNLMLLDGTRETFSVRSWRGRAKLRGRNLSFPTIRVSAGLFFPLHAGREAALCRDEGKADNLALERKLGLGVYYRRARSASFAGDTAILGRLRAAAAGQSHTQPRSDRSREDSARSPHPK